MVEKASVGGATRQEQGTSEPGTNEEKSEVAGTHQVSVGVRSLGRVSM